MQPKPHPRPSALLELRRSTHCFKLIQDRFRLLDQPLTLGIQFAVGSEAVEPSRAGLRVSDPLKAVIDAVSYTHLTLPTTERV